MFKRLKYYLSEMFPLSSLIGTLVTAISIQFVFLRLSGHPIKFHLLFLTSGVFTVSLSLLLRVMDEFKDYEDDKKNFPTRPLPSGKVYPADLKLLGWICVLLMILSSLGNLKILFLALIVLGYTFLMLKWFFIEEKMRKSLPIAFLSHHPIVFINIFYLLFALTQMIPDIQLINILLILPIPLIFTNWELARKIRAPQDETTYTTYSKIIGPRIAVILCIFIQLIIFLGVVNIFNLLETSVLIKYSFGFLFFLSSYQFWQFGLNPYKSVSLKKNAEAQILIVIFCLLWASLW